MLTTTVLHLLLAAAPAPDGGEDIGSGSSSADTLGTLDGRAASSDRPEGTREAAIARHPEVAPATRSRDEASARVTADDARVETTRQELKQAEAELSRLAPPGSSRSSRQIEAAYAAAVTRVEHLRAELSAAEAEAKQDSAVLTVAANKLDVARGRAGREYDVRTYYTGNTHSLPLAPAEVLLQVLGQVVVEKSVDAGWQLLSKRLEHLAGCAAPEPGADPSAAASAESKATPLAEAPGEDVPDFRNTCKALEAEIRDLIAQPETLVRAVIMDVLDMVPGDTAIFDAFGVDWRALRAAWRADGATGVRAYLTFSFQEAVIKVYRDHATCPKSGSIPTIAAWMIGACAADTACDISALTRECVPAESQSLVLSVVSVSAGGKEPRDAVNTLFELARLGPKGTSPYLEHLQGLVVGLLDSDTTRAMSAAADMTVQVLTDAAAKREARKAAGQPKQTATEAGAKKRSEDIRKLFEVMAGAARYAAVKGSEAEKMAARKDVVKDLITRMTRRGNRDSGWVVSLGGSFGVVGGARMSAGGTSNLGYASPMHVGLGLGLDSYHSHQRGGLHFELSVLDLGQYVVFTNRTLSVEKPDIKAAIAPSLKLGGHFALKETPMYLAGFVGLSPFVREKQTAQEHMTVSWGLIFGVYIPFIDFN